MTHDEIQEMLGAYALDALSPEERDEVDAHLTTCTTCAEEAAQLLSVHDQLALAAIEMDPPPGLRTRLINLVELDRAQWEQAQARTQAMPVPMPGGWWERLRGRLRRLPAAVYGAGGAIVVAVVVLIVVLANRGGVTVHTYPGSAVAQVVAGVHLQGVQATVGVRSDHTMDVRFSNLPALPASEAYELWLIPARGNAIPVGGFISDARHNFSKRYAMNAGQYAAAAVSIEHAPGDSATPTHVAIVVKFTGSAG